MKFSVIVPAYNREKELKTSIESVLNQTYRDFELIVVDNGSTDGTKQVVESYSEADSRVRYFWQENSGSPAGSRNTGIQNARYDWVAFLDSDDYWTPDKLQEVSAKIHAEPDVIAVSHYEDKIVDGTFHSLLKHGHSIRKPLYENLLFSGNAFSVSAMVVRRESLIQAGLFDVRREYFAVEDYDMWMKLSRLGDFAVIEKSLGAFCITGNNMSGNIDFLNKNLKCLVFDHLSRLSGQNVDFLKKKHGARIDYYRGRSYQLAGEWKKALPILLGSIKAYPWSVKKYVSLFFALAHIRR